MGAEERVTRGDSEGDLSWPLRRAAALFGSTTAVIDGSRAVSYTDLARRVGGLGRALDQLEVPLGGRVGFLGENSLAHLESVMGVPMFGRVLVDLNFRLTDAELSFMARDCGIDVLFAGAEHLDRAQLLHDDCRTVRTLVADSGLDLPAHCLRYEDLTSLEPIVPTDQASDSLAAISYTGGTTGTPKGVMLSHGNLLANARHNLLATGHSQADRWLHVCPMFHVAGTANIFACTWVGATQILLPRFAAERVAETIQRESVTHALLVPTMLAMLLEHLECTPAVDIGSLSHVQYAASPISADLQRRLLEKLECDIAQFYGMTEAAPTVTHLSPTDHRRGGSGEEPYARRLRSIGTPVVGVQAEVRGPDGTALEQGHVGELVVRGPNVMLGYWNRPDATGEALSGGWYRTGDAAFVDGDGYLFLVDRLKDMIVTGGENVYSIEVESALARHDAVAESAVFGVPHDLWGEAVHAVVSLRDGAAATPGELADHCRTLIAGYKVPREIEIRTGSLPRSAAGKVLKHQLREPFWVGQARRID